MAHATVGWWHRTGLVNQKSCCGKGVEQLIFSFCTDHRERPDSQITGELGHVALHQEIRCRPLEGRERRLFARVLPPHWIDPGRFSDSRNCGWRLGRQPVDELEGGAWSRKRLTRSARGHEDLVPL
jgi:hypothetical protein